MNYDRSKLHQQCAKYKIEPGEIRTENRIIFFCPEIPDEKIRIEIVNMIPKEIEYQFVVGPKASTTETLILMFRSLNVSPFTLMNFLKTFSEEVVKGSRHLSIEINTQIPDDAPLWNEIEKLIAQDGFYKTWTITLGDKTITEKTLKIATEISEQHNIRDHAILDEDIINLRISLYKEEEQDVLDFIEEIK